VAIKLIAPQLSTSRGARKRFAREARAAAAISHENVVQIYSVPEVEGIPYLVMEYVPGISLQQKLDRREPIDLKEILRIGQQTAAGLAAAHAQGLIHRDIKPPNILLEQGQDRVKITDFGLARMVDDASLTQSGVLAGTPQFMAPEQARGEAQDHRVDLFSLGSVLYTLCTGSPPFRANTTMAVLRQVSDQDPRPIRELNPRIPTWLCAIIAKLHEKDPIDRFQTAKSVADLLGECLAHVQDPVRFPMPAWHEKRSILGRRILKPTSRAALLGFLIALVGAVAFWQGWQALSWASRPNTELADNQPNPSSLFSDGDSGVSQPKENLESGLIDKTMVEQAFTRVLLEKRALEAKVIALQRDLQRVRDQLLTSRTQIAPAGSKLSVSDHGPERSAAPTCLAVPQLHDAKALALSPDGRHLAAVAGDDRIRIFACGWQKNAEYWMAAFPEQFDPIQIRVRELQQRYQLVRKEIPKDLQSGIWEDALAATLEEYLDRMPRVMKQRGRLEQLQRDVNALETSNDGKGYGAKRAQLNRELDEARGKLDELQEQLRNELRHGVMRHMQSRLAEATVDPEQVSAIEALIRSVNAEAQRQRLRPTLLMRESPAQMGEIREETSFDTACKSVTALEYIAGGKLLIGCGKGPELFIWDAQTGAEIKRLKGNESPIVKFAHCADTDQVVLCSRDATIRFWTPGEQEEPTLMKNRQSDLRELVASASGEWLTLLTKAGQMQAWQRDDDGVFSLVWKIDRMQQANALAVTPDQGLTACLMSDNTIQIFDGETGDRIRRLRQASGKWTCLAFVPQSDSLVVGSRDGSVTYFDTHSWQKQGCVQLPSSSPVSFSVSPNCRFIGARQADGHACLAPLSARSSAARSPTYSAVELEDLFPAWFEPTAERIVR
ncbi:MAG TPA: protein kinase, partial [Gemmataceae bacterium]|jgi:serine/threonine-protein kinase|nr:protein kinase [Gemmataceae bacterium]